MEGVVERGTAQGRADCPATRSPARPARRRSWSTAATRRPTTTRRSSASCRRAIRRVTIIVVIDSPHAERRPPAARSSAPIFKRIAEATLRYLGVAPTINPRRRCSSRAATTPGDAPAAAQRDADPSSASSPTDRPARVPDLRGMSAREALRKLVQARPDRARRRRRLRRVAGARRRARRIDARRRLPRSCSNAGPAAAGDCGASHDLGRAARRAARTRPGPADDAPRADAAAGVVTGVAYDSRAVAPGQVFVALKGLQADGAAFARQAIERGAAAIVSEQPRAGRRPRAVGRRRATRGWRSRCSPTAFYRPSERRDAGGRHHRHERQDDDGVSARVDLRGRRHPVRHARHRRLPHRRRGPRGDAHDARSAGRAAAAARDGRAAAAAPA